MSQTSELLLPCWFGQADIVLVALVDVSLEVVVEYEKLSKEDFDALVTGELTHNAIWLEDELVEIISDYFFQIVTRADFQRLLLRRDGLSFQDKIEIVRALLPRFANQLAATELRPLLVSIEEFKSTRNAFAHGLDVTPSTVTGVLHVEIINRAGKERVVVVTPESHRKLLIEADSMLKNLQNLRLRLFLGTSG